MAARKLVVRKLSNDFDEATELVTFDPAAILRALPPGHVAIRHRYVGINASDVNYTAGRYDTRLRPPFDCGFEGIGEIVAVASDVKHFRVGGYGVVMAYGAFSDLQVVRASLVIPVSAPRPEFLALLVSGLTASIALKEQGRMTSGETVLVTAAAGGAGQIAVQLAKQAGNHVIGTCSSDDKAAALRELGCDRVINYKKENVREVLRKEYRKGVDIVFESVGGQMLQDCFDRQVEEAQLANNRFDTYRSLAVKGRLIVIGAMSAYSDKNEGG
ncbi:Prostaglandin reductase 3 [Cladochytrium tenue]|nr:Prostaglandin reductase 3 [Cladochytrium tenue]